VYIYFINDLDDANVTAQEFLTVSSGWVLHGSLLH